MIDKITGRQISSPSLPPSPPIGLVIHKEGLSLCYSLFSFKALQKMSKMANTQKLDVKCNDQDGCGESSQCVDSLLWHHLNGEYVRTGPCKNGPGGLMKEFKLLIP